MNSKVLALAVLLAVVPPAQAQRSGGSPEEAAVEVDLQAGAARYQASGTGQCQHAPRAAIYGVQAAMFMVSHRAERRSLRMTLWQPPSGRAMVNLDLSEGSSRLVVDTVKGGSKKDTKGSGEVTFRKEGEGGAFTVDAVAASGEKIRGTIRCKRFGGIRAEGG